MFIMQKADLDHELVFVIGQLLWNIVYEIKQNMNGVKLYSTRCCVPYYIGKKLFSLLTSEKIWELTKPTCIHQYIHSYNYIHYKCMKKNYLKINVKLTAIYFNTYLFGTHSNPWLLKSNFLFWFQPLTLCTLFSPLTRFLLPELCGKASITGILPFDWLHN